MLAFFSVIIGCSCHFFTYKRRVVFDNQRVDHSPDYGKKKSRRDAGSTGLGLSDQTRPAVVYFDTTKLTSFGCQKQEYLWFPIDIFMKQIGME